jgi:hypothetical protein
VRNGTTTTAEQSSCAAGRPAAVNPLSVTLRRGQAGRRVAGRGLITGLPTRLGAPAGPAVRRAASGIPPTPLAGILAGCEGAGFAGSGRVAAGCGRSGWRAVGLPMVAPTRCAWLDAERSGIFLDGRGPHLDRAFDGLSLSGISPRGCRPRPGTDYTRHFGKPFTTERYGILSAPAGR